MFLFAGVGKREDNAMSEASLSKMLALMGDWRDKAGQRITVHGFRSTFKDWAAECTAFPREVSEVALSHAVGDETYEAYQRGDMFEKRRVLMKAWESFIDTVPTADSLAAASSQANWNVLAEDYWDLYNLLLR